MQIHPSHKTRVSFDASTYDDICDACGATDAAGEIALSKPCPNDRPPIANQLNKAANVRAVTWEGEPIAEGNEYDQDYFLYGQFTGKSLYTNYHWMPDLTIPMVRAIADHLHIKYGDTVLDFGCARGYVVKAFRELGYNAYGYDVSRWAIDNSDPKVYHYLSRLHGIAFATAANYDWIIAKDVLEHVKNVDVAIEDILKHARKGVFVVVPLAAVDGFQYVIPEYECDVTHLHRFTLGTWARAFMRPGWTVEASYRVKGVKCNYAKWEYGNGFLTCRRIEE